MNSCLIRPYDIGVADTAIHFVLDSRTGPHNQRADFRMALSTGNRFMLVGTKFFPIDI